MLFGGRTAVLVWSAGSLQQYISGLHMQEEDERCCGTGTCILNARGRCWCGQQWDGLTMCKPATGSAETTPALVSQRLEQGANSE